jgi:hypothetical protein
MRTLREWFLRFAGLFRKDWHERELLSELESHLQMHFEDNLRAGMSPEKARRSGGAPARSASAHCGGEHKARAGGGRHRPTGRSGPHTAHGQPALWSGSDRPPDIRRRCDSAPHRRRRGVVRPGVAGDACGSHGGAALRIIPKNTAQSCGLLRASS